MLRYIDADKIFYRERMTVFYNSKPIKEYIAFKQDIENVQTEDVAPVIHAHWIKSETEPYACSNCNRRELWMNAVTYEYCPHCGAKMDGEKE